MSARKFDWLAIVNPAAGAMRRRIFTNEWLPRLERVAAAVHYTSTTHDAASLTRRASRFDGIVAVGGDGTIKGVLAGIDRSRQRMAVFPAGRGNCLARDLGVVEPPVALSSISDGHPVVIDLIEYEMHRCDGTTVRGLAGSTIAIGYVAAVVRAAEQLRYLGAYAYATAAFIARSAPAGAALDYDDGMAQSRRFTGIVINNTCHLANFQVFPLASLTDGVLHVMETNAGWAKQNLHNISILSGRGFYQPGRATVAKTVHISLPEPAIATVDGELLAGVVELKARCLSRGVACQRP